MLAFPFFGHIPALDVDDPHMFTALPATKQPASLAMGWHGGEGPH